MRTPTPHLAAGLAPRVGPIARNRHWLASNQWHPWAFLLLLAVALALPGCREDVREQAREMEIDGQAYVAYPADSLPSQLRPIDEGQPVWMRVMNIDSAGQAVWVFIGIIGQMAYFGRMGVQWVISEKRGESTVPPIFWWLSLTGASMLLLYGIWRQDIVWIMGQSFGWIVYTRNLMLLKKTKAKASMVLMDPSPVPEPRPRRLSPNED